MGGFPEEVTEAETQGCRAVLRLAVWSRQREAEEGAWPEAGR